MNNTVVEGRKIEVNNATARIQPKKIATPGGLCVPGMGLTAQSLNLGLNANAAATLLSNGKYI